MRRPLFGTVALVRHAAIMERPERLARELSLGGRGTVKSAWFPFVSASAEDNSLFVEQAISLGRFGVLTILFPTS
jgi:hypothetical protein